MAIHQWPEQQRPREKLLSHGASTLSDAELLAIVLRNAPRGRSALEMAQTLLAHYGDIPRLLHADFDSLKRQPGLGPAKCAEILAISEIHSRSLEQELSNKPALSSPADCHKLLQSRMRHLNHEQFACIFLDNRNRLLRFESLFRGTIDASAVYPRTVVERCIKLNAAAIIFAHNHPSGVNEPSDADIRITHRLQEALALIDVRVLDHFIIGDGQPYSMAEKGELSIC